MKSVLLVDDDVDLCDSTSIMIKSFGYECVVANSGKDAQQLYENIKPNLVLLDIQLQDTDGYETFFNIKKIDSNAQVIFMSAFDNLRRWQEAKSNCAIYLIEKPFTMEFLKEMIDRHISKPFACN